MNTIPMVTASADRMMRMRSSPRCSVSVIVSSGGGTARSSVVTSVGSGVVEAVVVEAVVEAAAAVVAVAVALRSGTQAAAAVVDGGGGGGGTAATGRAGGGGGAGGAGAGAAAGRTSALGAAVTPSAGARSVPSPTRSTQREPRPATPPPSDWCPRAVVLLRPRRTASTGRRHRARGWPSRASPASVRRAPTSARTGIRCSSSSARRRSW